MNNTNQILEFLKAELNSIASNDISIEDSNRIASELLKKCNDIKTCLHFLSLLKSNSKKTLSFKKFASAYLKNIYQGTSSPPTKSKVIDTNPESSNYNKASTNKAWRKFGEEELNQDSQHEDKQPRAHTGQGAIFRPLLSSSFFTRVCCFPYCFLGFFL